MKKNILLIYGGGGTEHEISEVSARFLKTQVDSNVFNVYEVEIKHDSSWSFEGKEVWLDFNSCLFIDQQKECTIDLVIPCLHGFPGETGDLQSYLEMIKVPFIGCGSETSKICFNKASTKLWLESSKIPTTPFITVSSPNEEQLQTAHDFFKLHKSVFVKATNQGSSVGCYPVNSEDELADTVMAAYALSPYVIIEKSIKGRELEVAVFEYNNSIHCTPPGEIVCPSQFYSYDEKYNKESQTKTFIEAPNLSKQQMNKIKNYALKAFEVLKLRHLCRVDFFLADDGEIFINEINTFPGMTPISMFPKMMEHHGVSFKNFFAQILDSSLTKK